MRVFLFMFILVFTLQAKPIFSNTDQADSSQYIDALKNLVVATQKTRGLTNSYLNGNLIALMLVQDAKSDMKKAIGTMESLKLASDPVINQRASGMSSKLIELNRKGLKLKPEEAFERYTQEIEQILMLAQTVSKRSADHMTPFAKDASFVMMEQMLPLTEYVGQLRGYGSGIAAKGAMTQEQKEFIREYIHISRGIANNINQIAYKSNIDEVIDINILINSLKSYEDEFKKFISKV